ncbi:hypothetical protein FRACYDRAFT_255563 [Fragilariopsis cylindrus CCMP1102]|uniref:FAS1 domain-containing protein n=1 Tax=Fragilariopsis cylindrus CCMP1102 TaxID=635003 RepID=A0A1E7EKZ2_9STRA|nr:hypothetical protein FRACYDRAFT_255563 [Fragilariopsis cylindrus CCMP1102]|eukprot:OEU06223.1 hypothetical protein FRACYDRAFT_255563 [Fragilariopsis cylindrus CCMP1102]
MDTMNPISQPVAQPLQTLKSQLRRGGGASAGSGSDTPRSLLQQEEKNDRRSLASIGGGNDVNDVNADGSSNSNNNPNLPSGNSDCTRSNPDCTQSPIPIPVPDTTVTTATEEEEVEVEETDEDCLIETICSIPELEILCGYMLRSSSSLSNDDDSSGSSPSSNSSYFTNSSTTTSTTFFAPNNDAFDSLPALIINDITTNPDVFKNILMYHSVITEESIIVNDLICNEELIMAYNNETTKTLCFGGSNNDKKVQIGNGNLPMRSLPFIIQSNINACNGQTLIHIVDQVILPSLPLTITVIDAEETAIVINSSIVDNEDEVDDEDEGEGVDICGGILETICSTNELETLCTLLDMLEEESSLDFLLDVGTFFAPTNRAFDSLAQSPPVFADLLEDVDILLNLGIGNMPMRTLPKIIFNDNDSANSSESEIITCDRNAIIHLVDQVILPSLPLSSGNENGGSLIIETTPEEVEEAMIEGGIIVGDDDDDDDDDSFPADGSSNVTNSSDDEVAVAVVVSVVTVTTTRAPATTPVVTAVCPLNPEFNSPCRTVGDICDYDHLYTGCTWEDLQCTPVISCECFSDETWQCLIAASVQCDGNGGGFGGSSMMFEFDEPVAAAAVAATTSTTATIPDGLPWGDRCDPNNDLPQEAQPDTIVPVEVEGRLNGECPKRGPNFGSCSDEYVPNLICEYDYIYTGCSWDELSCGSVMSCECDQFNNGDWACRSFSMFPCNAQTTPDDLPWGQSCDPSSPLPEEPDQQEQQRRPSSSMRDIP